MSMQQSARLPAGTEQTQASLPLRHGEAGTTGASYRQTVKATSVTGASTLVVLVLRLVKTKIVALLLGPEGVGLFGLLTSVGSIVSTGVGLGINKSGVRQVAEASASDDRERIACVIYSLRKVSFVLGSIGALALLTLARPIAALSFGSTEWAAALAVLGLLVLFQAVNDGQTALLRGLRRIGDLARLNVWGALWGTVVSIPVIWLWGLEGVAPSLVVTAAFTLLTSWWFARRVRIPQIQFTFAAVRAELKGLLRFGIVFMLSGVLASVVQYAFRMVLARTMSLEAVGQFQAAAALSMVAAGFMLQAMSMDFYPRLTAAADDNQTFNRLVNEQAEMSMLLAGPGIVAMIVFSPWITHLLYSSKFAEAAEILRWQSLGVLLRVASWPVGFTLMAKGKGTLFLCTEMAAHVFHLFAFWVLTSLMGLLGAGMAFALYYTSYLLIILQAARHVSGFRCATGARRILTVMASGCLLAMLGAACLPTAVGYGTGGLGLLAIAVYAYRQVCKRVELSLVRRMAERVREFASDLRFGVE